MNDTVNRNAAKTVTDWPVSEVAAGAILTIDLSVIRENYRRLKARLGGVRCAGVVKANGYGLGAAQVAAALAREGCDIFFVALLAEGIALRKAIGTGPDIYVLNGLPPGSEPEAVAAGLCAAINSGAQLQAWRTVAHDAGRRLPAALQVDSGMSRLGMAPAEVEALAGDSSAFDGIDIRYVMSHLACADEPHHPANEQQRLAFERLRAMLPRAPASLANSSGIFSGRPIITISPAPVRRFTASTRRPANPIRCCPWCGCRPRWRRRAASKRAPASAMATPITRTVR